jgi:hypothetical protein
MSHSAVYPVKGVPVSQRLIERSDGPFLFVPPLQPGTLRKVVYVLLTGSA